MTKFALLRPARLLACVATALLAIPATSEPDPQSAQDWRWAAKATFAVTSIASSGQGRSRAVQAPRGPDPAILRLVQTAADEAGISRDVMLFHVKHESGFRPDARNPRSTATGLLQVIRGTHEAIIGRTLTMAEHVSLMSQPGYALKIGAAHMRACMDLMPGASAERLWRGCHIRGHAAAGGRIEMAARYFKPDAQGWLQRGSVAMPWSQSDRTSS